MWYTHTRKDHVKKEREITKTWIRGWGFLPEQYQEASNIMCYEVSYQWGVWRQFVQLMFVQAFIQTKIILDLLVPQTYPIQAMLINTHTLHTCINNR